MPALPRVFHVASTYVSHRLAGEAYSQLLEELGCLTHRIEDAQVAFVHCEVKNIPELFNRVPALMSRYCVGYTVWETDKYPDSFGAGLRSMDELWTASSHTAQALWRFGRPAQWLPHVTCAPGAISEAAHRKVAGWLGQGPHPFDVLCVTKSIDSRKDVPSLERAMAALRRVCPGARLILKVPPKGRPAPILRRHGVVEIGIEASDEELAALRARCHLVASSHRSEGWGMTLSEAMAQGCLTLAPAYSGNMTFMTHANSLLVPSTPVRVNVYERNFEPDMHWGQVLAGALQSRLIDAWHMVQSGEAHVVGAQAQRDLARYDAKHVRCLLRSYLTAIGARLEGGWQAPARESQAFWDWRRRIKTKEPV